MQRSENGVPGFSTNHDHPRHFRPLIASVRQGKTQSQSFASEGLRTGNAIYKYLQQTYMNQQPASTSGIAIAGIVFSIIGWFTCGLLCIPGAFLCFLALFSRGPKGTAIAGLIVGFPGTLFFAFFGLTIIMGVLGLGAAATTAVHEADKTRLQSKAIDQVHVTPQAIDKPGEMLVPETSKQRGDDIKSESLVEAPPQPPANSPSLAPMTTPAASEKPKVSEPAATPDTAPVIDEAKSRIWTTADGKHKIEATFVKLNAGAVTLKKKDGSTVDVKLSILCLDDKDYVKQRK